MGGVKGKRRRRAFKVKLDPRYLGWSHKPCPHCKSRETFQQGEPAALYGCHSCGREWGPGERWGGGKRVT